MTPDCCPSARPVRGAEPGGGKFYVTVNQLHRHPLLNQGRDATQPPFLLVRFRPLAPSEVGR
jgi:hypothetical protein